MVSQVVIFTGRLILIIVVAILVTVAGTLTGVAAAGSRTLRSELRLFRASRRTAAHSPHLVGKGPSPAAVMTNGTQMPDELNSLLPIRSSLVVAPIGALLVHGGQHLTDIRGQQVVHLVALQVC